MHPTQEEIVAFATGRAEQALSDRVESHLAVCEECGRQFDNVSLACDPLIRQVRQAGQAGETRLPTQFGRYRILEYVGKGGMADVFKAFDPQLQRHVALKVIKPWLLLDEEGRTRFRLEAEAAASFQHANIVPIFDFGEQQGAAFCALEFVEGGDLARRIAAGRLPPREAAEMLAVLADAVQYAHRRNVIHRDLKPANVLLAPGDTPKITDFGLCKRLDVDGAHTTDGALLGTLHYMAPEQAAGELAAIGWPTDVYGLGTILYEMLTGHAPFQGRTLADVLADIRWNDPAPPSRHLPGLDPDLETICLKCLEKSPGRRYPTAAALADDLRRFLAGVPVSARKPGLVERARKWARRSPWVAALSAAIVVLVAVSLVILTLYAIWLREALLTARRNVYSLQLRRAAELSPSDPDHARELIEDASCCPPDLRDFTWEYVYGVCQRERGGFAHGCDVYCMAVAPDKSQCALGDAEGRVALWARGALSPSRILDPQRPAGSEPCKVVDLAYHPTRRWLGAALEDGGAIVWDLQTGLPLKVLGARTARDAPPPGCNGLAFLPGGGTLATAHRDGSIRIWDIDSGKCEQTLSGHTESVLRVSFNCDGTRLASGSKDGTIGLWSVAGWRRIGQLEEHHGYVTDVRFHPTDPSLLASASNDLSVRLWSIEGSRARSLAVLRGFTETVNSIAFSADGAHLGAGSSDSAVRVWSVASRQLLATFRRHQSPVTAVAFDGHGGVLGVERSGRVHLWSVEQPVECADPLPQGEGVITVACLSDGATAVSGGSRGTLRFWDCASGRTIAQWNRSSDRIGRIVCAPQAPILAWEAGGTVWSGRFADGRLQQVRQLSTCWNSTLAIAGDGAAVAVDQVGVFSLSGEKQRALDDAYQCLAYSPVCGLLAIEDRKEPRPARLLQLAPAGAPSRELLAVADEVPSCLASSADGRTLAIGTQSGPVVLCSARTGRVSAHLQGHASAVISLAFSPDGRTLASGADDGEIRLWDAGAGPERARIATDSLVRSLVFPWAGKCLLSAHDDGRVRIWRGARAESADAVPSQDGQRPEVPPANAGQDP